MHGFRSFNAHDSQPAAAVSGCPVVAAPARRSAALRALLTALLAAAGAAATFASGLGLASEAAGCCKPTGKDMPVVGGNLGNQRYSALEQIDKSNLHRLGPAWRTRVSAAAPATTHVGQQTTPIVVDGVIYLDTPSGGVIAVNGATGEVKWKWQPTAYPTSTTRRGVSVGEGKVYTLAGGNRVVALDKETGAEVWVSQPTGPGGASLGNVARVATIYYDGLVYVGTNDAARNAAFAVRASDGSLVWAFYGGADYGTVVTDVNGKTIDAGATWGPPMPDGRSCALTGGVAPWMHGSLDPELGMIYWTFGNVRSCRSSQDGELRPGENLFGDSVVALDLKTGAYKWHFQSIRHDIWDMDNVHPPLLADVRIDPRGPGHRGGKRDEHHEDDWERSHWVDHRHRDDHRHGRDERFPLRKVIYYGSKSGHLFVLDRTNGKPVLPVEEVPMTQDARQANWPTQPFPNRFLPECLVWQALDPKNVPGHPWRAVPNYNGYQPDASGRLVYTEPNYLDADKPFLTIPPQYGANHRKGCMYDTHWDLPVLSTTSQNGGADWSSYAYNHRLGLIYVPYGVNPVAHWRGAAGNGLRAIGQYQTGGILAIDAATNRVRWRNHLGYDMAHGQSPLATAGDLVFVGQFDGNFVALDAATGRELWRFQTGAAISGGPITYEINGEQYMAVFAGGTGIPYGNSVTRGDSLWAFKLGGRYRTESGSPEAPTPAPLQVRRPVSGSPVDGSTVDYTVYLARPDRTSDTASAQDSTNQSAMNPTHMVVPVGTTVTFLNPGPETFPNFPNRKVHCATQFFEGLFNARLAPGERFRYTFKRAGEYFFNDCTDPRPTGKIEVVPVVEELPGALRFVPGRLDLGPSWLGLSGAHGLVTAQFDVPRGYRLDGDVWIKTPLSAALFAAVSKHVAADGRRLILHFRKDDIDNNVPEGDQVPLTVIADFLHQGVQKQLRSTAHVRVVK